jgi:hypothetical protein
MARVTQLRLRFDQQKLLGLRVMRRMAGDATDVILRMYRVDGVHVFRATGVTGHTAGVDFLRRSALEQEYFGFVAAARHMVRTRTMAALATLLGRAASCVQGGLPVGRFLPGVVDLLVTGLAGLRAHIFGIFGGRFIGGWCAGGFNSRSRLSRSWRTSLASSEDGEEQKEDWHDLEHVICETAKIASSDGGAQAAAPYMPA